MKKGSPVPFFNFHKETLEAATRTGMLKQCQMKNLLSDRQNSMLSRVIENALDAFIVIDTGGLTIGWSSRAEELFGWSSTEALGKPLSELIVPMELRQAHIEGMRRYLTTGQQVVLGKRIEISAQRKDGRVFPIELSITSIEADGQQVFSAALRDITERKQKEHQLREADRMKDEFLAMLGHELRNPLAPISTAAEVLKLGDLDQFRIRRASDVILRQVDHMRALLNDLLDASRVARGRIELKKEVLELGSVVADAVEQAHAFVEARGHHLVIHPPAEPIRLEGDRTRLTQILVNLLSNAAKYTPEGGTVSLSIEADENKVVISVQDNGVGIPCDLMPYLFDYFTQGKRTVDRSEGGLGLGLGLVKTLVELHHGHVWAESEGEGRGSAFFVQLPALESAHVPLAVQGIQQANGVGPFLHVMIVDDNVDAANALAMLVQIMGHKATVLHSGGDALQSVRTAPADLVFLDIGLPDIDGYEVARRIRTMPDTYQAVLVALTGYGLQADVEKAKSAGFDHHLLKPANREKLLSLLTQTTSVRT